MKKHYFASDDDTRRHHVRGAAVGLELELEPEPAPLPDPPVLAFSSAVLLQPGGGGGATGSGDLCMLNIDGSSRKLFVSSLTKPSLCMFGGGGGLVGRPEQKEQVQNS